jgi:uncharacterized membrane protein
MTTDDYIIDLENDRNDFPTGPRGMTPNAELMRIAHRDMEGYWGIAIGTSLLYGLITGFGSCISFILMGALLFGMSRIALNIMRKKEVTVSQLFDGFNYFGETFAAFIVGILVTVLFSFLFIIPGVIKGLGYSMASYIMADHPSITGTDALEQSQRMMFGNKGKLFRMQLRIAGLGLLCLFTCGIGYFFLIPYARVVTARFYQDVRFRSKAEENEIEIGMWGLGL